MTCTVAVTNGVGTQTGKLFAFDAVSTVNLTGLASAYNGLALTAYVSTRDGKTALAPLATCTAGTTTASFVFDFRTAPCRGLFASGNETEQSVRFRALVTATGQVVADALLAMVPGPEAGLTTTSTGATAATLAQAQGLVDTHAADPTAAHAASAISVAATPTNYTAAAAQVEAHLTGINAKLGAVAALSDTAPVALAAAAAAGNGTAASRHNHVHPYTGVARYISAATLPTGGSIVTGQLVLLTAADSTAKAGPGVYMHDGTGWTCLACVAAYDLGNLTGAVGTLTLIPGGKYLAAKTGTITSMAIVLTRPGLASIRTTGAQTVATPTMTGLTVVGYGDTAATAWTDAGAAIADWTFESDGTYGTIKATELAV